MKAGVVDDDGQALHQRQPPTEAYCGWTRPERMCESIRQAIAAANLRVDDIAAIGVATPGTMDIPAGLISTAQPQAVAQRPRPRPHRPRLQGPRLPERR